MFFATLVLSVLINIFTSKRLRTDRTGTFDKPFIFSYLYNVLYRFNLKSK